MPRGILRTARPKQWVKNVLVFVGPIASGLLFEPGVFGRSLITFVAFTLMASGVYFLNDARDVSEDRHHPTKRNRPIAAGVISVPMGYALALVGIAAGLALMATLNGNVLAMGVIYIAINVGYSLGLKNVPIVDLLVQPAHPVRFLAAGVGQAVGRAGRGRDGRLHSTSSDAIHRLLPAIRARVLSSRPAHGVRADGLPEVRGGQRRCRGRPAGGCVMSRGLVPELVAQWLPRLGGHPEDVDWVSAQVQKHMAALPDPVRLSVGALGRSLDLLPGTRWLGRLPGGGEYVRLVNTLTTVVYLNGQGEDA